MGEGSGEAMWQGVAARAEEDVGRSCRSAVEALAAAAWSAAIAGGILGVGGSRLLSSLPVW